MNGREAATALTKTNSVGEPAGGPTAPTSAAPVAGFAAQVEGAGPVVIYTDGACRGNPGPGGWGAWLTRGAHERELFGGAPLTTNNRMELTAVIEALASLKRRCEVVMYTDSQYVKNGITQWIHGWKVRGWTTADKKPVKNVELWQRLDTLNAQHQVQWRWVKGHSGDPGNERADRLANKGVDSVA